MARIEPVDSLAQLKQQALGCTACGLRAGCTQVVFGEGDLDADLMLIGEGPGADEDEQGRPFVGRAGQLLNKILEAAGYKREEVYITNVVMCRPPGNRTPLGPEIATCLPWLEEKIRLVRPRILVLLGSTASRALISPDVRITAIRGRWHHLNGMYIMPTFHPAALLRDPGKKKLVWEDFQEVRDLHRRLSRKRREA